MNKELKQKYYFTSDLHGVAGEKLNRALKRDGFDFDKDILVIAGDITDGLKREDTLIPFLRELDAAGRLIAVRGNHDIYSGSLPYGINLNYMSFGSDEDIMWVENLPFVYENENFSVTHGIYLDKETSDALYKNASKSFIEANKGYAMFPESHMKYADEVLDNFRVWGSPVLIGWAKSESDWWYIDERDVLKFLEVNPTLPSYESKLEKDTYIGHFWNHMVKERDVNNLFEYDEKGFPSYGRIHYLDTDIMKNKKIKFKIKEY